MSDANISWEEPALKLLERRDRYTRNAIRKDFNDNLQTKEPIALGPDSFLTQVSDGRFSVIWQLLDGQRVSVRAVVPLTNVKFDAEAFKANPEELQKLREYVKRVVTSESKGEIEL